MVVIDYFSCLLQMNATRDYFGSILMAFDTICKRTAFCMDHIHANHFVQQNTEYVYNTQPIVSLLVLSRENYHDSYCMDRINIDSLINTKTYETGLRYPGTDLLDPRPVKKISYFRVISAHQVWFQVDQWYRWAYQCVYRESPCYLKDPDCLVTNTFSMYPQIIEKQDSTHETMLVLDRYGITKVLCQLVGLYIDKREVLVYMEED